MDISGVTSEAISKAPGETQDGGRFIDQGRYGCIFDPPLRCADAKRQKMLAASRRQQSGRIIGKVSDAEDATQEGRAALLLSKIPNYKNYFVFADPKSFCRMAPIKKQTEDDIYRCDIIKEKGQDSMWIFTLPWGGMKISRILPSIRSKGIPFPLEAFTERLLEIGAILALHGIVHYDLHAQNILLQETTYMPRLIDFGFAFNATTLRKETLDERWRVYVPWFPTEPPELTMFTGHKGGHSFAQVLSDMLRQKESIKLAEIWLGLSRLAQQREMVAFWSTSEAAKSSDPVQFFTLYWPALDAFSLGVYILDILIKMNSLPNTTSSANWPALQRRIKLVARGLLRMSPLARLDCVEALALWNPDNKVLQSPKAEAWLAARERDRAAIKAEA